MSLRQSDPAVEAVVKNVVNCSHCGGTVQAVSGHEYLQCSFCNSLVFATDIPLALDRITCHGTELAASCPCCQQPLTSGSVDERPALYCASCYGVLMKNEHFGAVLRERRSRWASETGEEPRPIDLSQYERQLSCPGCRGKMEVHPYFGPGNVVIDSCGSCGYLWLDHGELARLERAADGRAVASTWPQMAVMDVSVPAAEAPSTELQFGDSENPLARFADWLFNTR